MVARLRIVIRIETDEKSGQGRLSAPPACYVMLSYSNVLSECYFFSMVFSNINPETINAANTNTIVVFIFLPFLTLN